MSRWLIFGFATFLTLLGSLALALELKEELSRQEEIISSLSAREKAILHELEELSQKIERKRQKIETLQDEIAKRELILRQLERKTQEKYQDFVALKNRFFKRLKALAMTGRLGWLNLLFAPAEISSFMRRQEYAYLILEHDQNLAQKIAQERQDLLERQRLISAEKKKLKELKREYELQLEALERLRQEKMALLEEVRRNKKLYAETLRSLQAAYQAIAEMAAELKETRKTLEEMRLEKKREAEEKKKRRPPLIEVKGYLLPPVEGEVIHFFGKEEDPVTGKRIYHPGITISAPAGTPVRAPFGGTVTQISSIQGQGLVVFIDHGYHFLSVIGGLGKVKVNLGKEVETGEIIGEVGDLPYSKEGVYYELRYHDKPQNPLDWLDTSKLNFLR